MKNRILLAALLAVTIAVGSAHAAMGGGNPGMGMGGGTNVSNAGGFGMMNGMSGAPIVGDDGTAYIVSHNPTANPGATPSSSSFESRISAVRPNGTIDSLTVKGIVSRPVVYGGMLIATASLPDMHNYNEVGNLGSNPEAAQSILYAMPVSFTAASVPTAVSLDGGYASVPTIAASKIYVVTTDFGNAMMSGNTMYNGMYGSSNAATTAGHSYLYIVNFDGTLASKVTLQ